CREFVFFFQAEDGIRDYKVTGVQTCALPISFEVEGFEVRALAEGLDALGALASEKWKPDVMVLDYMMPNFTGGDVLDAMDAFPRSVERRVGKDCSSRWRAPHYTNKTGSEGCV